MHDSQTYVATASLKPRSKGFTLVELLVVIAIIGILIGLLLPAVQAVRSAARRMQCSNNLKQIGLAMHNYHGAFGKLPYGSGSCCTPANPEAYGGIWTTMILPYLEQKALYDKIDFNLHHMQLPTEIVETVIPGYACPADAGGAETILDGRFSRDNPAKAMGLWYTASMGPTRPDSCPLCPAGDTPSPNNYCCQGNNFGTNAGYGYPVGNSVGMFGRYHNSIRIEDVLDGTANTFMVGETLPRHCTFISAFAVNFNVSPTTIPINTMEDDRGKGSTLWWLTSGFKSRHAGGANFVMADGSVHFVMESIDFRLYNELGTRAGGEVVTLP